MNTTDTPLTDAAIDRLPHDVHKTLPGYWNLIRTARRMEHERAEWERLAKLYATQLANTSIERAELVAALESLDLATVRIGSFAPDNERASLIFAQDKARAVLAKVVQS